MKYIPTFLDLERVSVLINVVSGKEQEMCEIVDSAYHVLGYVAKHFVDCPHPPVTMFLHDGVTKVSDFAVVSPENKTKALEALNSFGTQANEVNGKVDMKFAGAPYVPWDLIRLIVQELLDRYLPKQ